MTNKDLGNHLERELADTLFRNGYWVHLLQQSAIGQPADIMASKGGHAELIDCKYCSNGYFDKNRIEPNQRSAMNLWEERGNGAGWFAVQLGQEIWMVELWRLEMTDKVRLDRWWFEQNAQLLYQWLKERE